MKLVQKFYEAKDGSLHRTKKLAKKQNKILEFLKSTKKIAITSRDGVDPRVFDSKESADTWILENTSSQRIRDTYRIEEIDIPISVLLKLQNRELGKLLFGRK